MYNLAEYGAMIADKGRTAAYARALEQLVKPGSVVLDVGCGPGILSLLACRAGAARVYAVEQADLIDLARELAAANGFADRIHFIQATSTELELPEAVDGIVSDLHGVVPLFRTAIVSILDARDRFLKPGGWVIPARDTLWTAIVTSPQAHQQIVTAWDTEYGFDLSAAKRRAINLYEGRRIESADLLSAPQCWSTLDYRELGSPSAAGEVSCIVERGATGHGIGVWFDCETAAGIGLSNSPASGEHHVYSQAFFPWPAATMLSAGDTVRINIRADFVVDDYVWTWSTDVSEPVPCSKAGVSYRQSTFFGDTAGARRWRRRAHTFVAAAGRDATVDRLILELMDRRMPLGEIASEILIAFPSIFRDWETALGRVGELSDRYDR